MVLLLSLLIAASTTLDANDSFLKNTIEEANNQPYQTTQTSNPNSLPQPTEESEKTTNDAPKEGMEAKQPPNEESQTTNINEPQEETEGKKARRIDFIDPTEMTENDLYEALFGISKPKNQNIQAFVSIYIDTAYVGAVTLDTDTDFSFFDLESKLFLNYIQPFVKKNVFKDYQQKFDSMQFINKEWLLDNDYQVAFRGSKQRLEITTPRKIRGIQTINLTQYSFKRSAYNDFETHFFTGFFDINFYRTSINQPKLEISTENNFLQLDTHLSLGPLFFDSQLFSENNETYLYSAEMNSFLFNNLLFARAGALQEESLLGFGIDNNFINTFSQDYRKKLVFRFETNEQSVLNIYSNGSLKITKDVFPGKYRVTDFPVSSGPHKITVELISPNSYKTKSYYRYISNQLLEALDYEFNLMAGVYDNRNNNSSNFLNRIEGRYKHIIFENKLGLFSLSKGIANITADVDFGINESIQVIEGTLKGGTPIGILSSYYNLSRTQKDNTSSFKDAYIGKKAGLSITFLKNQESNLESWKINTSVQNSSYNDFKIGPPAENRAVFPGIAYGVENVVLFKTLFNSKLPIFFRQKYTNEAGRNSHLELSLSSNQPIGKYTDFNWTIAINAETENEVTHINPRIQFNISLDRSSAEIYPIVAQYDSFVEAKNREESKGVFNGVYRYSGIVPIQSSDTFSTQIQFNNNNVTLMLSTLAYGLDNKFSYVNSSMGNKFVINSSIVNSLGSYEFLNESVFGAENTQTGGVQRIKVNTSFMFVGSQFALGQVGKKPSFAIVKKDKLLDGYPIFVNGRSEVRTLFPATISDTKPFQSSTLSLTFDSLPDNTSIRNLSLSLTPKYGKGYVTKIGEKADYVVYGTIIDQEDEPVGLRFLEIKGMDDNSVTTTFTNPNGRFEFSTKVEQTYEVKIMDYNAPPFTFILTGKNVSDSGILNLRKIKVIRAL